MILTVSPTVFPPGMLIVECHFEKPVAMFREIFSYHNTKICFFVNH